MDLTIDNVIQLYTPLAGLAVLAFWSGVLTQKLAGVIERLTKVEKTADGDTAIAVQMGIMGEKLSTLATIAGKLDREMAGVQRTLANLTPKAPNITEFKQGGGFYD